jgi:hypothetical protein
LFLAEKLKLFLAGKLKLFLAGNLDNLPATRRKRRHKATILQFILIIAEGWNLLI